MIHKNHLRCEWILIISILELSFWTFRIFLLTPTMFYKNESSEIILVRISNLFNYIVVLFLFYFYKNIKPFQYSRTKLSNECYLRTRKTVQFMFGKH